MTDEERLKDYAEEYVADKEEESRLKKRLETTNASIKQLMELLNKEDVELDNGTRVVYGVTRRESLDEGKLIKLLKKIAPDTQCIKTKEYIDMDILESEIYKGDFSDDVMAAMDSCRTVKEIPTLNIRKAKKGK